MCICAGLLTLCTSCNGNTPSDENPAEAPDNGGFTNVPEREPFTDEPLRRLGLKSENVEILIPGMEQEYHFLWISDMHIITENGEISAEDYEVVSQRRESLFVDADTNRSSVEQWEAVSRALDSCHADGILFGADMVDFASTSNMTALTVGLGRINTPYMYLRADHDSMPYHCDGITPAECDELHSAIDNDPELFIMEYPEFVIVGLNDSTSNVTPAALEKFDDIYGKGIPMILAVHVPIDSKVDETLSTASGEAWGGRNLTWGFEDANYYRSDENTAAFLEKVYSADGIVRCVLAGHLHLEWDGELTGSVHEHVFGAAYEGKYGVITVKGDGS